MSKKIKLVDIENAGNTVKLSSGHIDWNECMICQERTHEDLQCPADNKKINIDIGAGYQSFDAIIQRCCALKWFPSSINLEQLNEGHGIARTLQNHKAKWHKSCRNKYSDLKISRQEKRKQTSETEDTSNDFASKVTRHSCGDSTRATTEGCFFCGGISDDLHDASTFMIDKRVRECALELQDTVLLAKLSVGDLISQEAKYHAKCLIKLYNNAKRQTPKTKKENLESVIHGIVLAELIEYIDGSRSETDILPIFKLADLAKLYSRRIEQLGFVIEGKMNTTHLKNRILAAIPDLQAHKQGRDVLLIFNDDVGEALKQATSYSCDDEGLIIAKAAKIVRRDMLDTRYSFTGTFNDSCQQESVPQTLVSLVRMILGGPNIETQSSNFVESQTTLTISQLLQFNCAVRRRKSAAATYHTSDREPPLPIYLGMVIHAETRKRDLVDKLYNLGLSISYDRVMNISTAMGNSICVMFKDDDVVCPTKLRCDVFTTAAVDNIDHNPSSTSAKGSLHGTAISLFQHPSQDNYGTVRTMTSISENVKRDTIKPLPERYSVVPPVVLPKEPTAIPSVDSLLFSEFDFFSGAQQLEYRWLNHVRQEIEDDDIDNKNVTWSAFHANLSQTHAVEVPTLDISSVLPLFQEEAKSTAMIRHSMTINKECVSFLNPGQIPVMACDQPLYALAKNIQWNWPARYGENHIVIMFGGLHIEIAALRTIGDWLQNNGRVNALSQSNVASAGTAE